MTAAAVSIAKQGPHARFAEAAAADETDFTFRCLGYDFHAWIDTGAGAPSLCVACDLGDLPFSAENRNGRRNALTVLSRTSDLGDTKLYLTGFRRISLLTKAPVSDADDTVELISRAAWSVCRVLGYIDMLGEFLGQPKQPESQPAS
jgi:hypothetical protein